MTTKQQNPELITLPERLAIGSSGAGIRNHALCDGPRVIAEVLGGGYPIGNGWSPTTQAYTREIASRYNTQPKLLALLKRAIATADPSTHTWIKEASDAIAEAEASHDRAEAEHRQPIVIEVRGGVVQEVRNVPSGVVYQIVDHDCEEQDTPETPDAPALPPDPEGMNDARADWAARAVRTFQEATDTDDEDVLCDLLANLMHWADRNNYDFEAALFRARDHYHAETRSGGG